MDFHTLEYMPHNNVIFYNSATYKHGTFAIKEGKKNHGSQIQLHQLYTVQMSITSKNFTKDHQTHSEQFYQQVKATSCYYITTVSHLSNLTESFTFNTFNASPKMAPKPVSHCSCT